MSYYVLLKFGFLKIYYKIYRFLVRFVKKKQLKNNFVQEDCIIDRKILKGSYNLQVKNDGLYL